MPILDAKTGKVKKDYTVEELIEKAKEMRALDMIAVTASKSGHTGGTLSIVDVATALYLKHLRHDPATPDWDERDRVFWSTGHKAPVLYVALGMAGYFPAEETVKLRKLWSGFEGHPNRLKLPGIEASSGSLGQGLGLAVGSALRAKLDGKGYRVYCIMGDGEQQEGSVWEAIMSASHYNLDNLVGIVDKNGLQIDGKTRDVLNIEPLADKYTAFGWQVIRVDGHDMKAILKALGDAEKVKGKPTVILADTVKGKGVSYAENVVGYHGIAPKDGRCGNESLDRAITDIYGAGGGAFPKEKVNRILSIADNYQKEVTQKVDAMVPKFSRNYWWNAEGDMKVKMDPTRMGFGRALEKLGEDERVVTLGADITGSIRMADFYAKFPERKRRFFSCGIAEQNMTTVAAGLAKEGKIPFIGSYGVFITGRNWDQIRTTVCYNNYNVKIADAHGGVSVGPDGATHQALEELALMYYLPNMRIEVPCDSVETEKSTFAIAKLDGPALVRFGREGTSVVTRESSPFTFGVANVIRYRGRRQDFIDAFETVLGDAYRNEKEDLCIVAIGAMVPEAMRAACILKEEYGLETRVINPHTVKPLDTRTILQAAEDIGRIVTVEEHQTGGFGNVVAGVIGRGKKPGSAFIMDMIGVDDRFGDSGEPWELTKVFGLSAESIAERCRKLMSSGGK
ncbi:MAG: transketolase [Spirochaetes bacterium]|nr:transketolase [Spirochaetota bacterium]